MRVRFGFRQNEYLPMSLLGILVVLWKHGLPRLTVRGLPRVVLQDVS